MIINDENEFSACDSDRNQLWSEASKTAGDVSAL